MTTQALKRKADDIRRIARSHGVSRVRVFGSQATGHARRASDVDLLVTLKSDRDLLDLIDFKLDLQDLLGCEVDVVTEKGVEPALAANYSPHSKAVMKDASAFLKHIAEAIAKVEKYTKGGQKKFMEDTMIQDSVIRNLEIIGEAAKNLPAELRKLYPEVRGGALEVCGT